MKVGGVADQIWSLMVVWWWWRVDTQWVLIGGCAHGEDKEVDMFFFVLDVFFNFLIYFFNQTLKTGEAKKNLEI